MKPACSRLRVVATLCVLSGVVAVRSAHAQTWTQLAPLAPQGAPPAAFTARIAYDGGSNRLIVFVPGNSAIGGTGNQVWILTHANGLGGTPEWIPLQPSGTPPDINWGQSVVYDEVTNRLIVYGGCFANCGFPLDGVFVLANANGLGGAPAWTTSAVTNPMVRANHSAIYDSANDLMVSFGGQLGFFGSSMNDTRLLDNAAGIVSPSTWSTVATSGTPPGVRNDHSAVYDVAANRMIVYAGARLICCNFTSVYDDVWVLTYPNNIGRTPTWVLQAPAGLLPEARDHHSAVYDAAHNRMLVFGGSHVDFPTQTRAALDDLWELSDANGLGTPTWTELAQFGTPPGPRFTHAAAFDGANQRMIVYGGADQSGVQDNSVWVLARQPASVGECKNGGWSMFDMPHKFRNQGDCIQFVNTGR
jgi:hypothetical protein